MLLAAIDLSASVLPVVQRVVDVRSARDPAVFHAGGVVFDLRPKGAPDLLAAADPQPPARAAPRSTPSAAARVPAPVTREAYEAITKLHPGYHAVPENVLAALPASYPDGTPGEMTYYEPTTGYRDEIGIRAKSSQLWAISMDPRARANMIANAHASKWFPIHFSAPGEPGKPVRPWLYPNKSLTASTTKLIRKRDAFEDLLRNQVIDQ